MASRSDRIRKNMPAVDSKTVPVARSVLTTPLARRKPPTQARDRDFSSRSPCQQRTFKAFSLYFALLFEENVISFINHNMILFVVITQGRFSVSGNLSSAILLN